MYFYYFTVMLLFFSARAINETFLSSSFAHAMPTTRDIEKSNDQNSSRSELPSSSTIDCAR